MREVKVPLKGTYRMITPIAAQTFSFLSVTGQWIMDAVREVAGREYREEEYWRDGKFLYLVGRSSRSYADNVIAVGNPGNPFDPYKPVLIDPKKRYEGSSLSVMNVEWPGDGTKYYAPCFSHALVIESVREFAAALQEKLEIKGGKVR